MLQSILAVFILFNLFYFIARLKKDFSIIDIAWGISFVVIIISAALSYQSLESLRMLVLISLVVIWCVRLSGYIFYRSVKLGKEDYRYTEWRKDWGDRANVIAYFKVYLLQAALSLLVGSPLILFSYYAQSNSIPFGSALDLLGVSLWLVGFLFEAIGDYQKNKFKSNPDNQGRVMQSGLWKYSRHPNYFGEAVLWWGIFFIILNTVPWYYAVWGPVLINFLLLKVSGVSLLEQKYTGNTEYDQYKLRTSSFLPWFPKEVK